MTMALSLISPLPPWTRDCTGLGAQPDPLYTLRRAVPIMAKRAEMWRLPVFILIVPINVSIAWATFLGAKLVAALVVTSPVDQTVMAVMAVVLLFAIGWAIMASPD
jgi:hypothetical protein